ncbi:MAG: hypothetical protein HN855_11780 [Anaerolineae bacterium]|nr:hypothetical protein [Anaerolineae bacterium]MBT7325833.1 hypothetical protein [Anaerolineae bacterium]
MKRKLLALSILFLLLLSLTSNVLAQEEAAYLFTLEKEEVHVFYEEDGSISLDYLFVFKNAADAHVIDFVDVGMPNYSWDLYNISADVNGNSVDLSREDYMGSGTGFAVVMGNYAIQAGERGTVHVHVSAIDAMLRLGETDKNYLSGVFGTTWFGSEFLIGTTDFTLSLHLPTGVQPDEPRYHPPENWRGTDIPETFLDNEGRVTYTWHDPEANGYTQYRFGTSFPKNYVPESAIIMPPSAWSRIGNFIENLFDSGCLVPLLLLGLPFSFFILEKLNRRKRKMQYLSPKIAIEGHGIKRGLTAVEAAVLMETPLDKVMTMILFSTVKKGAATITSRDPLSLDINLISGLHAYENDFLLGVTKDQSSEQQRSLQKVMVDLIKTIRVKMKGFSRKETVAYYQKVIEKAWEQVESAATPEVKSQQFSETLEWTMLDKKYPERTQDVFRTGPVYVPMWWTRYDPTYKPVPVKSTSAQPKASTGQRPASSSSMPSASSMPQLPGADFAASIVGGAQTFSQKIVGDLGNFTKKVTNITNPAPVYKSSSRSSGSYKSGGRSGGGSSCACACACAGCACACAGGGR